MCERPQHSKTFPRLAQVFSVSTRPEAPQEATRSQQVAAARPPPLLPGQRCCRSRSAGDGGLVRALAAPAHPASSILFRSAGQSKRLKTKECLRPTSELGLPPAPGRLITSAQNKLRNSYLIPARTLPSEGGVLIGVQLLHRRTDGIFSELLGTPGFPNPNTLLFKLIGPFSSEDRCS